MMLSTRHRDSLVTDTSQVEPKKPRPRIAVAFLLVLSLVGLLATPAQASTDTAGNEVGNKLSSTEATSLSNSADLVGGLQSSLSPVETGPQAWEFGENSFLVVTTLEDNFENASYAGAVVDAEGVVVERFETVMSKTASDVLEVTSWSDGEQVVKTSVSQAQAEAQAGGSAEGQVSTMSFFGDLVDCLENDLGISTWAAGALAAVCAGACIGTAGAGCVACAAGVLGITGGQAGYCIGQAG